MNSPAAARVGYRFSLRWLLIAVVLVALSLWIGRTIFDWWNTVPTVPLAVVVDQFNERASQNQIGAAEPALTVNEVLIAIRAQLSTLNRYPKVKSIYEQILKTQHLPADARLDFMTGYQPRDGHRRSVWWVNIDVRTGKESGYTLRIRENNAPIGAQTESAKTIAE